MSAAKRRPVRKPADYDVASEHFDAIEHARTDLVDTFALFTMVIDAAHDDEAGFMVTLERHLLTDLAALNKACAAARTAILSPLFAVAHPERDGMGTP